MYDHLIDPTIDTRLQINVEHDLSAKRYAADQFVKYVRLKTMNNVNTLIFYYTCFKVKKFLIMSLQIFLPTKHFFLGKVLYITSKFLQKKTQNYNQITVALSTNISKKHNHNFNTHL